MIPLSGLIFWVFALVLIAAATMVISSRNPVHSVLFLILAFFNAAALFLIIGAEFLAMLLVVVYVGAVAVLFLFVVMMLDINTESLQSAVRRHGTLGLTLGGIFLLEIFMVIAGTNLLPTEFDIGKTSMQNLPGDNTAQMGALLYTHYLYIFQIAGLILLTAMIGAITLTLRQRAGVKRQSIADQVMRSSGDEITMHSDITRGNHV